MVEEQEMKKEKIWKSKRTKKINRNKAKVKKIKKLKLMEEVKKKWCEQSKEKNKLNKEGRWEF